jgi:cyclopropane fatty-acyl-phospholipid synthase-like methyltransferase
MSTKSDDRDYRGYVGGCFDTIGAHQLEIAIKFGLRQNHTLLDIGCGSLRAGRFFMMYLNTGSYYGIEPNKWLVDEGIEKEIGEGFLNFKKPKFLYNDNFESLFTIKFDFIIAHSIISHTSLKQMKRLFRGIRRALKTDGVCLATANLGNRDYSGSEWNYPGGIGFTLETILKEAREVKLNVDDTGFVNPTRQSWIKLTHFK